MNLDGLKRVRLHNLLVAKMHKAGYQTHYKPVVVMMKREFLKKYMGVVSSKELEGDAIDQAYKHLLNLAIKEPDAKASEILPLSIEQRKKIIRIGRYVLGKHYGDDKWFWAKLPVYVMDFHAGEIHKETGIALSTRKVRKLDDLTRAEAHYVIQRLEAIEYNITCGGKK